MDLQLEGDAALVTASSSGLGKAAAKALVREGANVVINGRDEGRLERAREEVAAAGDGRVVAKTGDLTDSDDISDLVSATIEAFGGIDHLVTSAGGPPSGPFIETTDRDWYEAYDLLVMSVVRLVREAADELRAGDGGNVVHITSISVKEAIDSLVLSNSVRMGVIGLAKTLSRELAPEVRFNSVLPGPIETERTADLIEQAIARGEVESYQEGLAAKGSSTPLGRIGRPMELGNTVAFLCSPTAAFINGVTVPIDGGLSRSNL
ncbi:SDR family oxidoreductase [Halorubrum sp. HHNYT27]|uniref:SDR family oxidoreductase n=1 Tax=Halorubrum sp. HHNYT27 TaxID=3402275 RepID=UPI003EB99D36